MHSKQRWPSHQAGEEELGGSDWLTWVCYLPTDTHAHLRPVPLQRVRAQRSRREHDQLRRRPAGGLAPEMGGDQAHKHDDYDGALGTSPPPPGPTPHTFPPSECRGLLTRYTRTQRRKGQRFRDWSRGSARMCTTPNFSICCRSCRDC